MQKMPYDKRRKNEKSKTVSKAQKWATFRRNFLKGKKNFQDYYICEICGSWVKNIEVDHIVKRSIAPNRVFDETNLRLLCPPCHRSVT